MTDTIIVKYFGEIAEALNCSTEKVSIKSDKLSDLLEELVQKNNLDRFPYLVALNHNMINPEDDATIKNNDELAILPPFAGG